MDLLGFIGFILLDFIGFTYIISYFYLFKELNKEFYMELYKLILIIGYLIYARNYIVLTIIQGIIHNYTNYIPYTLTFGIKESINLRNILVNKDANCICRLLILFSMM